MTCEGHVRDWYTRAWLLLLVDFWVCESARTTRTPRDMNGRRGTHKELILNDLNDYVVRREGFTEWSIFVLKTKNLKLAPVDQVC